MGNRLVTGIALSVGLGLQGACASPEVSEPQDTRDIFESTTIAEQIETVGERATEMWIEALSDLRTKVETQEPVSLLVAEGVCLYWPASIEGVYTVIRNPAIYVYESNGHEIYFYPFSGSDPEGPELMNGPFMYFDVAGSGQASQVFGFGEIQTTESIPIFVESTHRLRHIQASEPEVFPPSWLETETGFRIAETQVVEASQLQNTFADTCNFQNTTIHLPPEGVYA